METAPGSPVTVVAYVVAKPGQAAALQAVLSALPGPTRLEAGCLQYDLHQSADVPERFVFLEVWRSKADLDRHLQTPHVTEALAKVGPLVAEPPQVTLWNRIS